MDISAVIVNYNGEKFLKNNITSLSNQTTAFKQIVIIDNNSKDKSIKIIKQFQNIELVILQYNSGYAHGSNLGIKHCNSDLILLLNSDIHLDKDFNTQVIKKFNQDKTISMLSPLILRFDGIHIDSAGQKPSWTLFPKEIGYNKEKKRVEIQEGVVFSVCGAATVFKKAALEKLKIYNEYYDEDFFTFWEDFDIGWRANLSGLKVYFYPKAIAYHYRSGTLQKTFLSRFSLSLGRNSEMKYHIIKNRYLTLIKNFRFRHFWWTLPLIIIKDIFWFGLLTFSSPKIIIKLIMSYKYIKRAVRKRNLIRKNE